MWKEGGHPKTTWEKAKAKNNPVVRGSIDILLIFADPQEEGGHPKTT